ncbi:hypothetical protein ACLQ28_31560 [Micromonospora sp. DT201]|uniref:hypothetical protein n=1 Tax=Micromonospora sp. DT201 TaxID=3393442 RepID=UPI003CF5E62B
MAAELAGEDQRLTDPPGRFLAAAQGQAFDLGRFRLRDDWTVSPLAGPVRRPITVRDASGLGQVEGSAAFGVTAAWASAGIQLTRSRCRYGNQVP